VVVGESREETVDFASVVRIQMFSAIGGGVLLLAVPGLLLAPFGLGGSPGTEIVARLLGGVLFALGATLAGVRDVTDRPAQIRVCVGNAVCDGCIALFLAVDTTRGVIGVAGWLLVAIFAGNCLSWLVALRSGAARSTTLT
jgi:hypothetical protein